MKKLLLIFGILLSSFVTSWAQLPPYYNQQPGASGNSFPFATAAGKGCQFIVNPGEFALPAAAPAGNNITEIWVYINANANVINYTSFQIRLGQIANATDPSWTPATLFTGAMTTVLGPGPYALPSSATARWVSFTLTTPFLYDPAQALIVEITQCGASPTGPTINQAAVAPSPRRKFSNPTACVPAYSGQDGNLPGIGLTLISAAPCTAPPTAGNATTSNAVPCAGANFNLNLTGNSVGTGQTYQWQSSANIGGPYTNVGGSLANPFFTTNALTNTYYQCEVTCSGNSQISAPVLVTPIAGLSGLYTINSTLPTGGTNFQTFGAAVAALSCGVSGPVIFDVVTGTGPYTENVTIPVVAGASATNTITFQGNGNVLTSANGPSTLELNGADFIKVSNLNIANTNASTAFACHLWNNADNNKFEFCTFTVPIANTATTSVPFSVSGSQTAATTAGASGINDTVTNSTMTGGYYNTVFAGNSALVSTGNYIANNTMLEFYLYGFYANYQNGIQVHQNTIERPTRATVSTTYGIFLTTGNVGALVNANTVRNLFLGVPSSTSSCYPIYISVDGTVGNENRLYNNRIYNNNHEGILYPIYAVGADYIQIYHNTIDVNHPASLTGSSTFGIYCTGTIGGIDVKNNIVTLNRGGSGARYCLYYTLAGVLSNNNVLLNTSAASATSGIGFFGTAQITMANWQAVNASAWDQQSVNIDPVYAAPATPTFDFTPTVSGVNNIGTPVGVTNDANGTLRSVVTPDPGAIEFTLAATDIAIVGLSSPAASGCYSGTEPIVVTIQNAGVLFLDFAVTPLTFTGSVAGAATVALSGTLNSGILAPNVTTTFTLTPTVNMLTVGTYTINVSVSLTGDANPANDVLTPAAVRMVDTLGGTLSAPVMMYCASGTPSLTLAGASAGTRQWQESTVSPSGPWTNVGAGGNTYTPGAPLTQTTHYQVVSNCNANTFYSNVLTITVNNPAILTTTPDTICGPASATLAATTDPGNTIKWFANAVGGSPLFTGPVFTTPVIAATTNYFAEASAGGGGADSVAIPLASGTTTGVYHHMFRMNTISGMTLTAIGIKCNQAINTLTAWDIYYRPDNYQAVPGANTNAAGWTLLSSATNVPSAGAADYTIISLGVNLPIPANAQYSFYIAPAAGTTHQYNTSTLGTIVASNADAQLIAGNRGSSLFNCTTGGGMACVKMIYSMGCAGTRVPVQALVNPAPVVTANPSTTTVCSGAQVTLSGGGAGVGGTYTWSAGVLDGQAFSPTSSTVYTVTGTDVNLCSATATSSVTVNPVLTGGISANPTTFCLGGSTLINATVTPLCQGNVSGFAGLYAPANWTLTLINSSGTVNTAGAPANVVISTGSNFTGNPGWTAVSKVIGCSGTVSFNWATSTSLNNLPFLGQPVYRINSGPWTTFPGFNAGGASMAQNGTANLSVGAGDTLWAATYTLSNDIADAYSLTISNFSAPDVPITGTVSIWDAPTGGNNLGTPPQTVTPLVSGTVSYYAEYTTDITGCINPIRVPVNLTVNALPGVTATATPAAICAGGSSVLSGGGATTYFWDPGTLSDPATVSPLSTSTYTVTGTDGNGCSNTSSVTVTVNPLPVMTSLTATPDPICANGSSTLTVAPGLAGAAYCVATHTNGCGLGDEYISNVTFASINQSSTCAQNGPSQYTDYTAVNTPVTAGAALPISVGNPNYYAGDQCRVYVDWNQNGLFTDTGEETVLSGTNLFSGTVNIPAGATNGATRMRVRLTYTSGMAACGNATYGETEDYTVTVSGGVAPTPSFATIGWSPATFLNSTTLASVTASNVTGTTTYTVTGTDANGCSVTSSVTLTVSPAPTGNTFGTPIVIGTLPYSTTGDNLAANCWTNAYAGANNQSSPDVFYQFVMPSCNDSVVLSLCGSGFDTYIHLLDNLGNAIATNDDNCGLQSQINTNGLTPGNTYYAVVEGFSSNTGSYTLNVNTYQSSALVPVTASITPSTGCDNSVAVANGGGATSYSWSGGLTDGQPFTVLPGTTTYTVTGTTAGCSATATVNVTGTAASGNLAPATTSTTQNHGDDLNASYYDGSCNLIASVDDGAGGNVLGLTTATVNVDANAGFHNGQPFVRRWYQITPASNGAADVELYLTQADFDNYNAVVTLPYLPLPTGPADATGIANVRITKNADAGLGNSPMEITPVVTWNGSYWVLSFTTPSFSQFRVHSANPGGTPLPVALTKFDGRKLNSSNLLEWTTTSEMNNSHFNLQYSTNGTDFSTIAKVDSKAPNGLSSTTINYSFEHLSPALGHNYYRLQQVDLDNQSTMNAKVVDLIWGTNGSTVSIYPNPTQDVLNIDLYTTKIQNTTVKVLDMSGRIVKQIQARSEAGMNQLSISLGEVADGVYTVQIFENDQLTHVDRVNKK